MNKITLNRQKEKHSTLSLRRATHYLLQAASRPCYFYPRSPCGERLPQNPVPLGDHYISIHALLAESDCDCSFFPSPQVISIHALLAESDYLLLLRGIGQPLFLSTLSLRRATFVARVS